jgi:hypothetical protein
MVDTEPVEHVPAPPPPAPSRAPLALATIALLIAAAALFAIVRAAKVLGEMRAQVEEIKATHARNESTAARLRRSVEALDRAVTLLSDEQVDLMNPKLQQLRHGFAISELAIARADTGVRVTGRMINAGSLRYRDATFRLKVENSSQQFTIDTLGPGGSGAFDVVLPNLPLERGRVATLSFVSSAVEYAR